MPKSETEIERRRERKREILVGSREKAKEITKSEVA